MISTLLAPPKKKSTIVPNIEVIGNPSANSEDINDIPNEHEFTPNNENTNEDEWYMHQNNTTETVPLLPVSPKYGFANKVSVALAAFEVNALKYLIYIYICSTSIQHLVVAYNFLTFNFSQHGLRK